MHYKKNYDIKNIYNLIISKNVILFLKFKTRRFFYIFFPTITYLIIICPGISLSGYIELSKDKNGWTIFTPSHDSRIIYVSEKGDDTTGQVYLPSNPEISNDPLNPSGNIKPFATYTAAYASSRNGYPDWILFKKGESFYSPIENIKSGRNESEPFLVGSYGNSRDNPVIKHGASAGLRIQRSSLSGNGIARYIAVSGLTFYAHTRDPKNTAEYVDTSGTYGLNISTYGNNSNIIESIFLEGCKWLFPNNNNIAAGSGSVTKNITVRRCVFLTSYPTTGHAQGLYATEIDGIKLEENIFDHNGWYSVSGSGGIGAGTIYNHNTYFSATKNVSFKDNIFMRGSNIHNKFTSKKGDSHDINIENNLYIGGHIGISMGVNYTSVPLRFQNISIKNNVFTNLGMNNITGQGIAWGIQAAGWREGTISGNLIMNQIGELESGGSIAFDIWNGTNCIIANNIVYRLEDNSSVILQSTGETSSYTFERNIIQNPYSSSKIINTYNNFSNKIFTDNKYYDSKIAIGGFYYDGSEKSFTIWKKVSKDTSTIEQITFPDDTRSIETYMEHIGEASTIDAFISKCRAQSRDNWDDRFMAKNVTAWIRAGFFNLQAPLDFRRDN